MDTFRKKCWDTSYSYVRLKLYVYLSTCDTDTRYFDDDSNNNGGQPRYIMTSLPTNLPKGIYLAPMVRGSELAMRMLARQHGNASLCYSPMLRDRDVISVHRQWKETPNRNNCRTTVHIDGAGRTDSIAETAYLLLRDTCQDDTENLVIQLCGSIPTNLGEATAAVLDLFAHGNRGILPAGIDLNLGCPQKCASDDSFGAFLVERHPEQAIASISKMRDAIDSFCTHVVEENGRKPTLSAKIRLMDGGPSQTASFVRKLHKAGVDYIAIHCRRRIDKHDGEADWDAARIIVNDLSSTLPVVLNGGIIDYHDATKITQQTKCHAVMVATGYLRNHRNYKSSNSLTTASTIELASQYLEYADRYPPPTYLYFQKHLRWILRQDLQPWNDPTFDEFDFSDSRVKLWSFLVRPFLRTCHQYRLFLALYAKLIVGSDDVMSLPKLIQSSVEGVTFKSVKEGLMPSESR